MNVIRDSGRLQTSEARNQVKIQNCNSQTQWKLKPHLIGSHRTSSLLLICTKCCVKTCYALLPTSWCNHPGGIYQQDSTRFISVVQCHNVTRWVHAKKRRRIRRGEPVQHISIDRSVPNAFRASFVFFLCGLCLWRRNRNAVTHEPLASSHLPVESLRPDTWGPGPMAQMEPWSQMDINGGLSQHRSVAFSSLLVSCW